MPITAGRISRAQGQLLIAAAEYALAEDNLHDFKAAADRLIDGGAPPADQIPHDMAEAAIALAHLLT